MNKFRKNAKWTTESEAQQAKATTGNLVKNAYFDCALSFLE